MNFLTKCWCCLCLLCCWQCICLQAGIMPLMLLQKPQQPTPTPTNDNSTNNIPPRSAHRFAGYIEYQPNGTITLRSEALENATNWQNWLLFKAVVRAIKLTAPSALVEASKDAQAPKINIRIYGEGIEHKFPPFLERILQRIQTFFSVYRYKDTSQAGSSSPSPTPSPPPPPVYATYSHFDDVNYLTTTVISQADDEHTEFYEYGTNFPTTTALSDGAGDFEGLNDDYNEFISIGETNDGFITVGED